MATRVTIIDPDGRSEQTVSEKVFRLVFEPLGYKRKPDVVQGDGQAGEQNLSSGGAPQGTDGRGDTGRARRRGGSQAEDKAGA